MKSFLFVAVDAGTGPSRQVAATLGIRSAPRGSEVMSFTKEKQARTKGRTDGGRHRERQKE